jgi:hypothetical protein
MRRNLPIILMIAAGLASCAQCALCAGLGYYFWSTTAGEPPGFGAAADLGYQTCDPIIHALERYHAQTGAYPEELKDLVPSFLAEIPPTPERLSEISYRLTDTSYQLEFKYAGPGLNSCIYTPENEWDCSGYY